MNGWESGLVVAAVMIALSFIFRAITNKTNVEAQYATPQELPIEFGLALWIVNFYRLGLVLSFLGAAGILAQMEESPTRSVALFIPAFFAFLTGLGLFVDTKKKVRITEDAVIYRSLFSSFELPISRIQRVWSGGGLIIIDIGEKTRKVIPMMFQSNGHILEILQSKAQQDV